MEIFKIQYKYGKTKALEALGFHGLALQHTENERIRSEIIETEGVMKFEERSKENQDKLTLIGLLEIDIDHLLHEYRYVFVTDKNQSK